MKTTLLPLAALVVALAPLAHAQVPLETFTASGPGTTSATPDANDPASVNLNYSDRSNNVYGGESWSFTALSDFTGTRTIDYSLNAYHAYYMASADLSAFDAIGTQTLFNSGVAGGFTISGEVTLDVVAGQDYGFSISGKNSDSDNILTGTITVNDVTAVPEPSTCAAMLAGGAGLLLVARSLRRSQVA